MNGMAFKNNIFYAYNNSNKAINASISVGLTTDFKGYCSFSK
jgi:hypothetical protein